MASSSSSSSSRLGNGSKAGGLLFDAGSLRDLLKQPSAGTTKSSASSKAAANTNVDLMIQAILQETGVAGLKRKGQGLRKKRKRRLNANDKPEVQQDPLDRARAQRSARNNIHEFASAMGIPGDDVNYLERQFVQVKKILASTKERLKAGYQQLIGSDSNIFTSNDASLLLLFVGLDIDEQAFAEICEKAALDDNGNDLSEEERQKNQLDGDAEDRALDFSAWLTGVTAWLRHYLMAGVLAERRGEINNQFLDSMAQTTSVALSSIPVVAPPPPSFSVQDDMAKERDKQHTLPPGLSFGSMSSVANEEAAGATFELFDDSMLTKMNRQAARRQSRDMRDLGQASTIGPGASLAQPSLMYQGSSSASVMSQTSNKGLPPIRIKQMQNVKLEKKKKLMAAGFNASLTRSTPRCLRDDLVAGDRTIDMLRRELQIAQEGLVQLNTMVDTNIAWVHSNCDMTALNGGVLSNRTREKCQRMAVERLFLVVQGYLLTSTHWAFLRWRRTCQYDKVSELARRISRLKGIEMATRVLYEAMTRQFLRGWAPWKRGLQTQQRWEQEAAVCEIARIVRGFMGRRRAKRVRRFKASIKIQCMLRSYKARRRVRMRRSYLRIFRAAKRIQWLFTCILLRARAKREVARRRKLKNAKTSKAVQRTNVARAKVESAEEKRRREEEERKRELEEAMAEAKRGSKSKGRSPPKAQSSPPDGKKKEVKAADKPEKKTHLTGAANKQVLAQKAKLREEEEKKKAAEDEGKKKREALAADAIERRKRDEANALEEAARKERLAAEIEARLEQAKESEHESVSDLSKEKPQAGAATRPGLLSRSFNLLVNSSEPAPDQANEGTGTPKAGLLSKIISFSSRKTPSPQPSPVNNESGPGRRSFDNSISSLGSILTGDNNASFIPIQNETNTPPQADSPVPRSTPTLRETPPLKGTPPGAQRNSPKLKSPEDEEKERVAAEEKEKKRLQKEEKDRLAAEEKARLAAEAAEKKRLEKEEKDRLAAEAAEKKRLEKEEKDRLAAEEKERKRLEKAEKERIAAEEREALRLEKEERERAANETAAETAERKRLGKIEKDRLAAEEKERKRLEKEESDRVAAEEKARLAAEVAEKKRIEKEEKERLAAEVAEKKRLEKIEADRIAAEDKERKRVENEEADKLAAEEKEKKKREKEAADRIVLEEKAKAAAEEKERKDKLAAEAAEKKRLEKEEKDRLAAEAAEKKRLEKEEKDRLAAEEKERKRIEKEALAASKPQTPGFLGSLFSRPSTASATDTKDVSPAKSPAGSASGASAPVSAKPSTANKLGGLFSSGVSSLLGSANKASGGATSTQDKSKKKKRKATGPPPTTDEATLKIQLFARVCKARKRIKTKRDGMMKEQKRIGQLLLWAAVVIQSVARMRQGRLRFKKFWEIYQRNLAALRLSSAIMIQSVLRGRASRLRVRQLWIERAERIKAEEWKEYQKEQNRRAKLKAKEMEELDRVSGKKSGRKSPELVDEDAPMPLYGGIDVEQVKEIDEKIQRMEELERRIAEKERAMQEAALKAEERQAALEKTLKAMEERAKADEAQRAIEKELLAMAAGPINSYRGPGNSARGPVAGSARGPGNSARPGGAGAGGPPSARPSARDQPPSARSARGGAGIPPDAPRVTYEGAVWVQLWDPEERHNYWYCEATQQAQWEEPGKPLDYESGYESTGANTAMTDYSTDHYTSGGSVSGSEWGDDSEWQEFWDESAQAKYWYNNNSGEATWTKPESTNASMASLPASARTAAGAMDWVSYIDEESGQEYWANAKTGETSWA